MQELINTASVGPLAFWVFLELPTCSASQLSKNHYTLKGGRESWPILEISMKTCPLAFRGHRIQNNKILLSKIAYVPLLKISVFDFAGSHYWDK